MGLLVKTLVAFCIGIGAMYAAQTLWLSSVKKEILANRAPVLPQVQFKPVAQIDGAQADAIALSQDRSEYRQGRLARHAQPAGQRVDQCRPPRAAAAADELSGRAALVNAAAACGRPRFTATSRHCLWSACARH